MPADVECRKGELVISGGAEEEQKAEDTTSHKHWEQGWQERPEEGQARGHVCVEGWQKHWQKWDFRAAAWAVAPGAVKALQHLREAAWRRILAFITAESSFPKTACQSPVLASHSCKERFKSSAASNGYHSDTLQIQSTLQFVLTIDITLVPYIISDIWCTILYLTKKIPGSTVWEADI